MKEGRGEGRKGGKEVPLRSPVGHLKARPGATRRCIAMPSAGLRRRRDKTGLVTCPEAGCTMNVFCTRLHYFRLSDGSWASVQKQADRKIEKLSVKGIMK